MRQKWVFGLRKENDRQGRVDPRRILRYARPRRVWACSRITRDWSLEFCPQREGGCVEWGIGYLGRNARTRSISPGTIGRSPENCQVGLRSLYKYLPGSNDLRDECSEITCRQRTCILTRHWAVLARQLGVPRKERKVRDANPRVDSRGRERTVTTRLAS